MFETVGEKFIFKYGKTAYDKAIEAACDCPFFKLDCDEDEFVTSTKKDSCYNCLFRRWSCTSFSCMHKAQE
ncbi:MAG TPA: molybdopterin biosynthesis protein MoeB [Sulfurimonas sp. UBA12504]|nr:MAG: hypothetical protein A2019_00630 [Sulfurimonas sp. GWF2_37_8]DAB30357.1 MAG TPA: molybdopterin biosynthesis protein MoeB [Sulfurimonas sp. UBA12504]